jgi:transketolase
MLNQKEVKRIKQFACQMRMETMKAIAVPGVGHIGGSLSVCDVIAVLYDKVMKIDPQNPKWEDRDYFVMSKGHSGPALYAALALKGYFPMEMLKTLNKPGTSLPSHCDRIKTRGIDMSTGSLGQGASSAAGIALGLKTLKKSNWLYLILGDGECDEGEVWEMALFANHYKLTRMITFIDANKQQVDGFTRDIMQVDDLATKFNAFGWYTQTIDGHDVEAIYDAIEKAKAQHEKPSLIVLNTIKGKGVTMWESKINNHNANINQEQLEIALLELNQTMLSI